MNKVSYQRIFLSIKIVSSRSGPVEIIFIFVLYIMNITFLENINPIYILLLYSTISSIIVIYISQYIKDIDKVSFQCIRYLCDFM